MPQDAYGGRMQRWRCIGVWPEMQTRPPVTVGSELIPDLVIPTFLKSHIEILLMFPNICLPLLTQKTMCFPSPSESWMCFFYKRAAAYTVLWMIMCIGKNHVHVLKSVTDTK